MHRPWFQPAAIGILVPLVMFLSAVPALAHGKHGGGPLTAIQGTVIRWSPPVLQVQTQTGAVSVNVTGSTHIVRLVTGSLSDLGVNQHVEIHVVRGTATVDSILIDPASEHKPQHGTTSSMPRHPQPGTWGQKWTGTKHPPQPSSAHGFVVVSVDRKALSITLRGPNGLMTYALSNNLTITKEIDGSQVDLGMGETVRVSQGRTGNAVEITILRA